MAIRIYGIPFSTPFRAVAMTADVLGVKYEYIKANPMEGDTQKKDFLALNPQHNIPVMEHGDYVLNESRAIAGYLAQQFDPNHKLYPRDPKIHSKINQRLFFDTNVFSSRLHDIALPMILRRKEPTHKRLELMEEATSWANDMIKTTGYVADTDHLTIADLCFLSNYSVLQATEIIPLTSYKEMDEWATRISSQVPNYKNVNQKGASDMAKLYKTSLESSGTL
uniref:Glutathione S-transferase 1, isoform C n=1 Tax=Caligus rogercresseyi TaxID=217165 RepID=C1BN85_CALRO|nr:Glutathione S-transferase 1, isoform C [Caligus rogercresseyi]